MVRSMGTELLAFSEARRIMLDMVNVLPSEHVTLRRAGGRVLSKAIIATEPWPRFDHSTMDGYAIATSSLEGNGPFMLKVRGESAAGAPFLGTMGNSACRIFTGAPLPDGSDAVIAQERVQREGSQIRFDDAPKSGAFVRRCGEDLRAGAVALGARTRLTPGASVLAAMVDGHVVTVSRAPKIALLPTGNELYPLGSKTPFGVPESISYGISALAAQACADVRVHAIVPDNLDATADALGCAFDQADLVVTIGGVSVGDHDHVRSALTRAGASLGFYRVAIKPGKPLAFGKRGEKLFVGLPGNPSSAMVTFALFVMPLLRAMQGDVSPFGPQTRARLARAVPRTTDRLEVARASFQCGDDGVLEATAHPQQASGAATSLAASDGLVLVPPGEQEAPAGLIVDAQRWVDL